MITRQLEIRDFILSLARTHFGVSNEVIVSLFQKYAYNTILSVDVIKTEIQKELLRFTKQVPQTGTDLFSLYGITSPEDFLKFLINNYEIGFLDYQDIKPRMIPLGGLRGISSRNKIVNYDDPRIVTFLQESYNNIPQYLKKNIMTLSDTLDVSSQYLLENSWRLQDPSETLKYMVGTHFDFIELAVVFFKGLGLKVERYSFSSIRNSHENHLFLAYCKDDIWYYFEPFFTPFIGIHAFNSLKELETMVYAKFMTYYTTSSSKKLVTIDSYNPEQTDIYKRALLYRDKAIYDYRLSLSDSSTSLYFKESCYEKWMEFISLFQQLPRTYEHYELKCLRDIAVGSNYYEYQSYLFYQKKSKYLNECRKIYEIEQSLLQMAVRGILTPGVISLDEGVFAFQEIEFPVALRILEETKKEEQMIAILREHLFTLVYDTNSFSRSVIRLTADGYYEQIKGIDLLDIKSSTYQYPLLQMKQRHALQITPEGVIRFRGTCSYMSLEKEKSLQEKLQSMHLLSPIITKLIEFSPSFLEKHKLPLRQEDVDVYLKRTGLKNKLSSEMSDRFISDNPRGLWFGQIKRNVLSPFRIADLSYYLERKEMENIKSILEFSRLSSSSTVESLPMYLLQFARTLGKQLSILFQHHYYYQWNDSLDDITLAGEFCDDKIVSYYEEIQKLEDINDDVDNMKKRIQWSYFFPFFSLVKALEVVNFCNKATNGKDIGNSIMIIFVGRFMGGLSIEKQEEFISFYRSFNSRLQIDNYLEFFPEKQEFLKENRILFRDMFSVVNDYIENPEHIINRSVDIIKEQEFIDKISSMNTADKFLCYLKQRFNDEVVDISKINIDTICNDSRMGVLIRSEPLMIRAISSLRKYDCRDFAQFCELGHDLITIEITTDLLKKEELKDKLALCLRKKVNSEMMIISINDEMSVLSSNVPMIKLANVSGTASPICLLFTLLGSSFLVLGIILSFLL